MKILVISDVESLSLWDYYSPEKVKGVDMIISCGDLDSEYLSFLVTMVNRPLFYVHGNHDGKYEKHPPEGCISLEDQIYIYKGIRMLGLGGSYQYSKGPHQYTERQMKNRIKKMWPKFLIFKSVDIIVTHAPVYGINDGEDTAHKGFKVFQNLIDKYHPKYFLHGHVHMNYGHKIPRTTQVQETIVINGYESYIFEYE